jgi:uncharacterized protein YodC (DUF2158 family)
MVPTLKDFAVGDVVRLNSGALRMTVAELKDGRVVVNWHDQDDACLEDDFAPAMLTIVKKGGA